MPELLAPAGSVAALHAAVSAGADAVYLGMGAFNARRNAENFTDENIAEVCDYAHLRGASVYVTMNTIVLPGEMRAALDSAASAYNAGADAFIVQDIGLMTALKREIPGVRLHVSTQMNIHNESGIQAAAELGAHRITLARELSIGEIAHLAQKAADLGMQVETFVHGALCVCYSGQCFMSSMIGGRSANRGLCAQACRLNYELQRADGTQLDAPGDFLLSPKDLCGIDLLQQLTDVGVASLKIEGRMKSPEYVSSVVSVYRDVLNRLSGENSEDDAPDEIAGAVAPTEDERTKLASAFSRGFTTAYLEGKRGNDIMSYQRPNNRGQFIGRVKWVRNGKVGISCEQQLVPGDVVEFWTKRGRSAVSVTEDARCTPSFAEVPLAERARVFESDRVFRVRSAEAAFKDDEHAPRIPVVGTVRLKLGEPLEASFRLARPDEIAPDAAEEPYARSIAQRLWSHVDGEADAISVSGSARGANVEPARSKEVTAEEVVAHIDRLGSTPFRLEHVDVLLDDGVGIGFSQLHHIRAEALENLQENLLAAHHARKACVSPVASEPRQGRKRARALDPTDVGIVALATNAECAHAAKRAGALQVYVPIMNYKRGMAEVAGCATYGASQASYPKHGMLVMPVVSHDLTGSSREARFGMDPWENITAENRVLVQGIGDALRASRLGASFEVGAHLPIVNSDALETIAAFGAQRVWLSPELNLGQIADLASRCSMPLGLKIFGAQELMTTEHCMLASQGACDERCDRCARRAKAHVLKDRKGYEFPVTSDALGRGHIYNSVKLDLTPELPQLIDAGVTCFMVDTTLMNAEQAAQAVGYCVHALHDSLSDSPDIRMQKRMSQSTSGHLHRGVQ